MYIYIFFKYVFIYIYILDVLEVLGMIRGKSFNLQLRCSSSKPFDREQFRHQCCLDKHIDHVEGFILNQFGFKKVCVVLRGVFCCCGYWDRY